MARLIDCNACGKRHREGSQAARDCARAATVSGKLAAAGLLGEAPVAPAPASASAPPPLPSPAPAGPPPLPAGEPTLAWHVAVGGVQASESATRSALVARYAGKPGVLCWTEGMAAWAPVASLIQTDAAPVGPPATPTSAFPGVPQLRLWDQEHDSDARYVRAGGWAGKLAKNAPSDGLPPQGVRAGSERPGRPWVPQLAFRNADDSNRTAWLSPPRVLAALIASSALPGADLARECFVRSGAVKYGGSRMVLGLLADRQQRALACKWLRAVTPADDTETLSLLARAERA